MKKIILANPRGFCAGVDRAITIVEKSLEKYGAPVYVRHEVVHNKYVVDGLKERGAIFIEEIKDVPENSILIYSAHGVPLSVRDEAESKNLTMIFDATCPLVSKVHVELKNLHRNQYQIIMIGHKGHPEVEGTMGQVDGRIHLIENESDVDNLPIAHDCEKVAVVTQTTLSVDETKSIIEKLKATLMSKGLEVVEIKAGDAFDADFAEAITQIPAPTPKLKGKIVDVIEKGYKLGDKIIRFPKVILGN